jgi:hypothetical protein
MAICTYHCQTKSILEHAGDIQGKKHTQKSSPSLAKWKNKSPFGINLFPSPFKLSLIGSSKVETKKKRREKKK